LVDDGLRSIGVLLVAGELELESLLASTGESVFFVFDFELGFDFLGESFGFCDSCDSAQSVFIESSLPVA
jgi:hypothetical protein